MVWKWARGAGTEEPRARGVRHRVAREGRARQGLRWGRSFGVGGREEAVTEQRETALD